jgi:branched-chain amino acid aminotransferase
MQEIQAPFQVEKTKHSRLAQTDFSKLNFGREFSDHMFIAEYTNGEWVSAKIQPYQALSISPASCVFHYGQAIFEGLKAHRVDASEILLFRPEENWKRLNRSAQRMCMAEVPHDFFINGIKELVRLDEQWVPEGSDKSLYIRPFLIADDAFLGVKPSERYKFMIITSPTANYYAGAVSVKIETHYSRAASGGIGAAKAAANYAASLYPAKMAQEAGYNQLIWTDSSQHKFIEESGTMNLMLLKEGVLITPSLSSNTILPGITRDSIIQLANKWGIKVEERQIPVAELIEGVDKQTITEVFGVGTAATIAPIKTIGYQEKDYHLSDHNNWEFTNKAKNYLEALKRGKIEDEMGWTVAV